MGIVNGTTNYMLTRMVDDGLSYDEALKPRPRRSGFAEADPTADVDGFDAAAKIAILASIAFNSRVTLDDVHTEGIRNITTLDHGHCRRHGLCHQAFGDRPSHARRHRRARAPHDAPEGASARDRERRVQRDLRDGRRRGRDDVLRRGRGSGPGGERRHGRRARGGAPSSRWVFPPIVGCTCTDNLPILPVEELQTKYYIRFAVADRSGVLAAMAGVFAKHGVSVRSVVQRGNSEHETVNLSYVTHTAKEASVRAVLAEIAGLEDVLRAEPSVIRVEG